MYPPLLEKEDTHNCLCYHCTKNMKFFARSNITVLLVYVFLISLLHVGSCSAFVTPVTRARSLPMLLLIPVEGKSDTTSSTILFSGLRRAAALNQDLREELVPQQEQDERLSIDPRPPGLRENDKFVCDDSVKIWHDLPWLKSSESAKILSDIAFRMSTSGQDGVDYGVVRALFSYNS